MDFSVLYNALAKSPEIAFLTLSLLANGWLVKALLAAKDQHLGTALQIAPLAKSLTDSISSVERFADRLSGAPHA